MAVIARGREERKQNQKIRRKKRRLEGLRKSQVQSVRFSIFEFGEIGRSLLCILKDSINGIMTTAYGSGRGGGEDEKENIR